MRISDVAALTLSLCVAASGGSDQPTLKWEATGFEQPESALPDPSNNAIYVSNVVGGPLDKDGNGYISKLGLDGKVLEAKWVTGLDSPKGLALVGDRLFVADLDQLVEIDAKTGSITTRHAAAGAKVLNGISTDNDGNVYVSDWPGNAIWRLSGGTFEKWIESPELKNPNGVLVDGDKVIVAAWGEMKDDFSTEVPGHLIAISIADKSISALGNGKPVGNLDGIAPFDGESYLVSDWVGGKVFKITRKGDAEEVLKLSQGSADFNLIPGTHTAIIPLMMDGKVVAYDF